jgi:hypothetical protein
MISNYVEEEKSFQLSFENKLFSHKVINFFF